jgi:hypothetical protein
MVMLTAMWAAAHCMLCPLCTVTLGTMVELRFQRIPARQTARTLRSMGVRYSCSGRNASRIESAGLGDFSLATKAAARRQPRHSGSRTAPRPSVGETRTRRSELRQVRWPSNLTECGSCHPMSAWGLGRVEKLAASRICGLFPSGTVREWNQSILAACINDDGVRRATMPSSPPRAVERRRRS